MKAIDAEDQYHLTIKEDGKIIDDRALPDPLATTTIVLRLSRIGALRLLFRTAKGREKRFIVSVDGTREAKHVIFTGDYTPLPEGPSVVLGASEGNGTAE